MSNDPLARYGGNVMHRQDERARADQVENNAGGFGFQVDPFTAFRRFLILGSAGGTYYVSESKLTDDAVGAASAALALDWRRYLAEILDVSHHGRAPKQEPTMFALAMAAGDSRPEVRNAALAMVPHVCRIGTHLFMFVRYAEQFRGWGRAMRRTVANWYLTKQTDQLAREVTKYAQRGGWSHRDLLRLSKPRPVRGSEQDKIMGYVTGKLTASETGIDYLVGLDELRKGDVHRILELIVDHRYPWEVIPSEFLSRPEVWKALVPHMGMTALVRNLGRMTANGAVGGWDADDITAKLRDAEAVKRSRIHPLQVLVAEATYRRGSGLKGSLTWSPNEFVLEALDEAFWASFDNVEPSNKKTLIGLDVSGSMWGGSVAGSPLTPAEAAGAMATIWRNTEKYVKTMAFGAPGAGPQTWTMANQRGWSEFPIGAKESPANIVDRMRGMNFGRTDCSLPIQFALEHKNLGVEMFIVLTDSETWAGRDGHPHELLARYRRETGIDARMAVVGMTATRISIADPNDPGMLDVVGFDTATPKLVADFAAGRL